MCSVVDGSFMEEVESIGNLEEKLCQKCKVAKPILTIKQKDVYCKMCFLHNCNHRFRSTLGKNKAIRPNDKILVAFSGGQGCLAVLKLIRNSLEDENNPKKVAYFPTVFIMDESGISENNFEFNEVLELAKLFDFPIYVAHLSMVLKTGEEFEGKIVTEIANYLSTSDLNNEGKELMALLSQTPDQTAKDSLIKDLKRQLLLRAAADLNCEKIFTGECATSLAITLLSGVATGRGAQVGNEAGFCDRRSSEVQILRPLREFSIKEVSFFIQHNWDYSSLDNKKEIGDQDKFSNIEELTKSFVMGLQEGFPSTVPTIFRTGDKLQLESGNSGNSLSCVICEGIIDTAPSDENMCCTALEATTFSRMVSEKGPKGLVNDQLTLEKFNQLSIKDNCEPKKLSNESSESCSGEGSCGEGGSCKSSSKNKSEIDWNSVLCYNCSHLVQNPEKFPKFLKESAMKSIRHIKMKNEIQDFLI